MRLWNFVYLRLFLVCTLNEYVMGVPVNDDDGVCITETCKNIGSVITDNLNTNNNPCNDFFEFACGGWVDKNPVPKFSGVWSRLGQVENETINLVREILENPLDNNTESIQKAQNMYKLCMDTERIEERGIDPLLWVLEKNHHWPILVGEWNEQNENLSWIGIHEKFVEIAGHSSIFTIDVRKDPLDEKSRILSLSISDPPIMISSLKEKNFVAKRRLAISTYAHTTVIELQKMINSTRKLMPTIVGIMELVRFENGLLKAALHSYSSKPKIMTVKDIQKKWDELILPNHINLAVNWLDVFNSRTIDSGIVINENTRVLVDPPCLLFDIFDVFQKNSLEGIANYIHWTFVKQYMKYTNSKMYSITDKYKQQIYSFSESPPRWRFCVSQNRLRHIVGAEFLKRHIDTNIRYNAKDLAEKIRIKLIHKIGIAFNSINGKVGQDPTNVLHAMKYNIGHPDSYLNMTHIDLIDEPFKVKQDYFESFLAYNKHQMVINFKQLDGTIDGDLSEWSTVSTLAANSYYDISKNRMIMPVGLLRLPFFHIDLPSVFIYSQVGTILGHEMSHAFTIRNEKEIFYLDEAKCFAKQYEKYEIIKGLNNEPMYVNVTETMDENVADNIGLDLSYEVYKQMKKEGKIKELKIPGLENFNDEQLFFLGFASTFCGKETKKYLLNPSSTMDHPPFKWRVDGAVSNMKGFSKAFNCPPNSPMNPIEKCSMWK